MNRALRPIAAIIPVALGCYLFQVHRQISIVEPSEVTVSETGSTSFLASKAYAIINPRGRLRSHDVRSIVIELPSSKRSRSEEEILADYVEGFFGGWVFAPERTVLQALRRRLVNLSAMAGVEGESIWTRQQLTRSRVPPLGSILFGTFQVIDADIENGVSEDHTISNHEPAESYVEFGFGSDRSSFSGFHRLSVTRLHPADRTKSEIERPNPGAENTPTLMRLTLSCYACNPNQDRSMGSSLLRTFHLKYAMLLFREGVANVLRA